MKIHNWKRNELNRLLMEKFNLGKKSQPLKEEKKGKDHDKDGDIDSDDYMAAKDKAIKKAMGKDEPEGKEGEMDEGVDHSHSGMSCNEAHEGEDHDSYMSRMSTRLAESE